MSATKLWFILGAMALSACAGNGDGLDESGQPLDSNGGSVPLEPTLQSIQANVFDAICINCHIGATAPQGLQLDAGHSYSLLVGVPSNEASNVLRVQPGDPDNSYLIQKLQGSAGIVGGRMPLGGPYLPQATIDTIRQWIVNGAPQAVAQVSSIQSVAPKTLVLTGSSPMTQSTVSAPVSQIVLGFSADLDASLVNGGNIWLERFVPGDTEMMQAEQLPATLDLAVGNSATVILRPLMPLGPGGYRVVLRGVGGGTLADLGGAALDADQFIDFAVMEPDSAKQAF